MNRIKSSFIGIYPMIAMGILGYGAWSLAASGDLLRWLGPLLTVVPFVVFLSWVMLLKNIARTSASFPGMNVLAVLGVALSGYDTLARSPEGNAVPLALASLGAFTFLLYSLWYSRLGRPPSAVLSVGAKLPELVLRNSDGDPFRTSELVGKPALMFFYRGNWCPLCMAQIKEVAAHYQELSKLGVRVLLISPQPHDNTVDLAKRFDVDFEFLTDEGNRGARALSIEMKNGLPMGMGVLGYSSDTVYPTVIVLNGDGVIQWIDQTDNYRVRPEPETFLPLLRTLAVAGSS